MEYLEFSDGIVVEIDNSNAMGAEREAGGIPGNGITELEKSFSDACDDIKKIIDSVSKKISEIEKKPDQIELSLGIKISSDTGLIIAKVGAEGSLGVKLTWKKEKTKP